MKQFYFILLSTFLVGIVAGVYIFFISKPEVKETGPESQVAIRGFEITADMYGGCQLLGPLCPSYRIESNGAYIYLSPQFEGEDKKYEGSLSGTQVREISDLLKKVNLADVENSEFVGTCPTASDGSAYRFEIITGGESFVIDTCKSNADGQLFEVLEGYFSIFYAAHDT